MALLDVLTTSSTSRPIVDAHKEAVAQWLLHLIASAQRDETYDENELMAEVMKRCCLYPGYWTREVGSRILESCGEDLRSEWSELLEASLVTVEADDPPNEAVGESASHKRESDDLALEELRRSTEGGEDGRLESWTRPILPPTVPIGVV